MMNGWKVVRMGILFLFGGEVLRKKNRVVIRNDWDLRLCIVTAEGRITVGKVAAGMAW